MLFVQHFKFEPVQKTHSTCFIRSKTTWLCLMSLNPIKDTTARFLNITSRDVHGLPVIEFCQLI